MAMSMKSLLTQSDEGDELLPPPQRPPRPEPPQRKQHSEPESLKQKFTRKLSESMEKELTKIPHPSSYNSTEEPHHDNFPEKIEETKSNWDKMTDSLKSFSSRKMKSSSVDALLNETNDDFKSERLTKTLSELNLNVGSISDSDFKDGTGGSKSLWLKGQLSLYLSKSKNHYNNRPISTAASEVGTSEADIYGILDTNDANHPKSSNNLLYQKTEPIQINTPEAVSKEQEKNTNFAIPLSTDETHLPLIQKQNSPVNNNSKSSSDCPKKNGSKKNVSKKINTALKFNTDQISKKTGKLSLSELLNAQRSSSPTSPMEEISANELNRTVSPISPTRASLQQQTTSIKSEEELPSQQELEVLTDVIVKEDLKHHFKPTQDFPVTHFQLWLSSLVMFCYLLYDLPPFISGLITGGLFVYLSGCCLIWFFAPSGDVYNQYREDLKKFLLDNSTEKQQHEVFKSIPKPDILQKPRRLKLWMSLSYEYNGTFEKELTKELYAVVDKETLYLFLCKKRIDDKLTMTKKQLRKETKKAAMERMEKEKSMFSFEYQIEIDLRKCYFYLKPDDLPIRRMWNKKYPMKLCTPREHFKQSKIDYSLEELHSNLDSILDGVYDLESCAPVVVSENQELFLFANTGREKEDWFYRIQLCIKPLKHQVSFSDIKCRSLSKLPGQSYSHYIVELMTESERVMQRHVKGKKVEPYLAWLNIFLGRAFWDFWHDKYWIDKIHQKIQNRLSKIDTPPFITNITLKDLNCGHNIPIIHKGSVPTLDEYGVWTDLQITYKGYFTLTLETQLNVDYYVNLVTSIAKQKDPKHHAQLSKLTKFSGLSEHDEDAATGGGGSSSMDTSTDSDSQHVNMNESYDDEQMCDEINEVLLDDVMDQQDGMDDSINPMLSDPRTKAFLESNTGKRVVGLVGWLAKSKIAKRVAETDFAKKAYVKAYEKFRKMPIILKVEVQSVKGNLAVNLPPPPTNRLWFGFRNNPVIFITASPKIGDKQVRLTYLTNWIERKLKEEFKKYLVLPSMQDLSIKLMDSQLKELDPERPTS